MKLSIELVPKPTWGINARSLLSKEQWDVMRKESYKAAGYRCEICGGKGPEHPVECHEQWHFDEEKHIQKLVGLISLCPACHAAKHYGRSNLMGMGKEVEAHLCKINGWGDEELQAHVNDAYDTWWKRNNHNWIVEVTLSGKERE